MKKEYQLFRIQLNNIMVEKNHKNLLHITVYFLCVKKFFNSIIILY